MDDLERKITQNLSRLKTETHDSTINESAAAVLILLVKGEDDWKIIFTRRTNNVRTHQGEVSFPGGAFESEDGSMVQTALREAFEEIGVKSECIRILGGLEPIRTISNFLVFPFIGVMECQPDFVINPEEVERLFMIPIEWLKNPENYYQQDHLVEDQYLYKVVHYQNYEGEHLWGLTARITQTLLELIK